MRLKYPTTDKVVEINKIILQKIRVKKADKHEVLSYSKIDNSISLCKRTKGDAYDKASCLLKNLTIAHPFGSGNRRTAFATTQKFLEDNKIPNKMEDNENNAKVFREIRYNKYKSNQLKEWIKNGKIKE